MKKILILGLIVCSIASCGTNNKKKNEDTGNYQQVIDLSSENMQKQWRDTLDMGILKEGEVVQYKIGIHNTDTAVMVIQRVYTGCGCASAEHDPQPIKPGETGTVTITYDSQGQSGIQFKHILVQTTLHDRAHGIYLMADVRN
ncbi:MAG: DUF1573 domain-containing protein [Rikenellaceae bacterium]|nr:DUF1573 domain-containing protein [Rikenellaceae bacterium]